jgi:uncharacterized membrane protein
MNKTYQLPTLLRRMGVSILLGMSIAFAGIVLEAYVEDHPVMAVESIDNIAIGVMTALLVFAYEQKNYRALLEKVRVIADMNHHVRNALQMIVACRVFSEQEKQVRVIGEAVGRIEWALREVLPGETPAAPTIRAA